MIAPAIKIVAANLAYNNQYLFQDFNLEIPGGHCTCLLGPSGVGKTSLIRLIAGLKSSATSSPIYTSDQIPLTGRVSYLAQNESLLPWKTVKENILIGHRLRGATSNDVVIEQVSLLLQRVGLEQYQNYFPQQLSGGMKQRVLLARTLFENRPVILMDEPFAAIDVITRTAIQELASTLLMGKSVLLVTHDPLEALRMGHHVYVMSGKPATITAKIELPGLPPRELTDNILLQTHAMLLDKLSHAKEVMEC